MIPNVNGTSYDVQAEGMCTLLHALRDDLGLLGAKEGCGVGKCGNTYWEICSGRIVSKYRKAIKKASQILRNSSQ